MLSLKTCVDRGMHRGSQVVFVVTQNPLLIVEMRVCDEQMFLMLLRGGDMKWCVIETQETL